MSSYQFTLPPPSSSFELLVDFDYQPYEPADTGPEAQYPGCPESITIEHVTLNGHEITSLLTEAQLEELEQDIWDEINRLRDFNDGGDLDLEPINLNF